MCIMILKLCCYCVTVSHCQHSSWQPGVKHNRNIEHGVTRRFCGKNLGWIPLICSICIFKQNFPGIWSLSCLSTGSSVGSLLESLSETSPSVCCSLTHRNLAKKPSLGEPCISFLSRIPLEWYSRHTGLNWQRMLIMALRKLNLLWLSSCTSGLMVGRVDKSRPFVFS